MAMAAVPLAKSKLALPVLGETTMGTTTASKSAETGLTLAGATATTATQLMAMGKHGFKFTLQMFCSLHN